MLKTPLCLIVDDEADIIFLLENTLKPMGIECRSALNLAEAYHYLSVESFDLCLTDMRLPDGDGISLVISVNQNYPDTPVIMITAHGNIESAVQAMKAGAFDFINKPVNVDHLRRLVNTALKQRERDLSWTEKEEEQLPTYLVSTELAEKDLLLKPDDLALKLIGESEAMCNLREKIEKLSRSQAPVYIRGESGTGKEVVARMIHSLGARADKPFIPVNCGAIPSELMESEFFGHRKGSFTGAHADKLGLFQAANWGTLFLDEVAELPLPMQVKLLRAIQEKQVRRVGSSKEESIDVRILSATHRNLAELVKTNKFRQDLFYRINVIELYVPPLRERPNDIPLLVEKILRDLSIEMTMGDEEYQAPCISPKAIEALKNYPFPGNVRELENILERAMTLCENNIIEITDLQLPSPEDFLARKNLNVPEELEPLLEGVEKEAILKALEKSKGNKTKAANMLGISFGALRYRMQRLKLGDEEKSENPQNSENK